MDWDEYADAYRNVEDEEGVPALLAAVMAGRSGTAVDVGCGHGAMLNLLRESFGGQWQLQGFEVSDLRAEQARSLGLEVLVGPTGRIPLDDSSVDVALSTHVIEHVDDDHAYAAELARIVRPGGHVYVETPVKLPGAWYFRRNAEAGWVLDPTHVREYRSAKAVNEVISGAGLQIVADELPKIRFPVAAAELLVRRILRRPLDTRAPKGLRALQIPIPRYRTQCVLALKPA